MTDDSPAEDRGKSAAARAAIRSLDRASLATAMADDGTPYASLVMTACDPAGAPLMMLSDLAEHTKNLKADSRAAMLFDATAGLDNPLTGTRVTLVGTVEPVPDETLGGRYVARHPEAEIYAGFADFNLYRMTVARVHVVAGFGEIHWLPAEAFLADAAGAAALDEAAAGIVAHMNDDHADAVALYATALADRAPGDWQLSAIDCDGIDLTLDGERARIAFERPVYTPDEARSALIALVQIARKTAENR